MGKSIVLGQAEDPRERRRLTLEASQEAGFATDATSGALVVLGYRDVERLLTDTRLQGIGLTVFDMMGISEGPLRDWYSSIMFTNEGQAHHRLRSLVGKAFSPRSVEAMRATAFGLVGERTARLSLAGGGDLVETLGDVPLRVMCNLLGVPEKDLDAFMSWVRALSPIFWIMTPEQISAATDAIRNLVSYTSELCAERERHPGGDLISALIAAEHEGHKLSRRETAGMVANLLVAGNDTTAGQMACTLHALLSRPEQLERLPGEQGLLASMVSETIRLCPSIEGSARTVATPLEIDGEERPAGTWVLLTTMTANRDPSVWQDAEVFDPARFLNPQTPRLLTFGAGPHACLGTWLARLTIEETLRGLSHLKLAPAEPLDDIPWVTATGSQPVRLTVEVSRH